VPSEEEEIDTYTAALANALRLFGSAYAEATSRLSPTGPPGFCFGKSSTGGVPNRPLYSRLNWDGLAYPIV